MSEALKRKLSDALAGLVGEIEALGSAYRFHATLLWSALKKEDQAEAAVAAE